jgi:hypothetical protein
MLLLPPDSHVGLPEMNLKHAQAVVIVKGTAKV